MYDGIRVWEPQPTIAMAVPLGREVGGSSAQRVRKYSWQFCKEGQHVRFTQVGRHTPQKKCRMNNTMTLRV